MPTPTESQVERDERRHQDYAERARQRAVAGLSPRKPRRRTVLDRESYYAGGSTPTTQFVQDLYGYKPSGAQYELTQSGFRESQSRAESPSDFSDF